MSAGGIPKAVAVLVWAGIAQTRMTVQASATTMATTVF
jgi:hypothetical protein